MAKRNKLGSVARHKKIRGKIAVAPTTKVTQSDLEWLYTPGVAEASLAIAKKPSLVYELTRKWNTVAIVTDGTRVLGLGKIGAEASLPVMEGKALLFKEYGNVDAIPLALKTRDAKEIISIVKNITPFYGAINLEDIDCPKCFEIEEVLQRELEIPVMHDDQLGTGTVALAGLLNALAVVKKDPRNSKIVIGGSGAAGIGIAKVLLAYGFKQILMTDSKGIVYSGRRDGMNKYKARIAAKTNRKRIKGDLGTALVSADAYIGATGQPNLLKVSQIKSMNINPIIFALTNPEPEIKPGLAQSAGAAVVATGRSDFPNQVNNSLAFPGIMRGTLDARASKINMDMILAAAKALAGLASPTRNKILPLMSDARIVPAVAKAVAKAAHKK